MEGFNTKCLTSCLQSYQGLSRSFKTRKAREIVRAIQLEQKMSKNQIIELYMNIIFLGENSYGVDEKNLKSVYCGFWITFWRRNMASVKTNESS